MRCVVAPTIMRGPADGQPRSAARRRRWRVSRLELFAVEGIPEVRPGDDLAGAHRRRPRRTCRDGDVVVVTQKIVSKAEGAHGRSTPTTRCRHKPLVEAESVRILRRRGDLVISETKHGFVCANAGIDLSNVDEG